MADAPDPPRKHYQLKPREFERVNERPGESRPGEGNEPISVRDHLRSAATSSPTSASSSAATGHDVRALLRDNLERRRAAGLEQAPPPAPRPSRRKRDYWIVFTLGNAALVVGTIASPVFGGAGLIIFNVGLAWIMWGVMDDY